jgi:hypothetical protein
MVNNLGRELLRRKYSPVKRGDLTRLARRYSVSLGHFSDIWSGRRRPGRDLSSAFLLLDGIPVDAWSKSSPVKLRKSRRIGMRRAC